MAKTNKTLIKLILECVKAIIALLLGYFGGNALF